MANLLRLLNNVRNNRETDRVFTSIDKQYPQSVLGANTPIANQAFSTEINAKGHPTSIYFSRNAYNILQYIRRLDQKCSALRSSSNLTSRSIDFLCQGYRDFTGDICITKILCPVLDMIDQIKFNSKQQEIEFLAFDKSAGARTHKTNTIEYMNHLLSNYTLSSTDPIGTEAVVLLGTTRHTELNDDVSNCFKLKELAEAVVKDTAIPGDISTGVIAITPSIVEIDHVNHKSKSMDRDKYLIDGSLECALITYDRSEICQRVKPNNIVNITRAYAMIEDNKYIPLSISKSKQPLTGIYQGLPQTQQLHNIEHSKNA